MSALFDLSGRTALVTGARRGIGLAMAEALALAGADIIGVSAQLEPEGSEVQRRVQAAGRRFTAHPDGPGRPGGGPPAGRGGHRGRRRSTSW